MNTTHSPDPKFVGSLERELRQTMRRQARFDDLPLKRAEGPRRLRWTTGLLALVAMGVGSAGTYAVTQRLRAQAADLIIARSQAELEFANARRDLIGEALQEAESRAAAGLVSPKELEPMKLEYAQVEADAAARALDAEEARITGLEPDNSLSAPLVQGRDFVSERLKLERKVHLHRASLIDMQANAEDLDADAAVGATQAQEAVRTQVSIVERRLALRRDFLSGALAAPQVELADRRFSAEAQREWAAGRVDALRPQLERARALVDAGVATRAETRATEMAFRAAQLQLDLAELELGIIERKQGESSGQ